MLARRLLGFRPNQTLYVIVKRDYKHVKNVGKKRKTPEHWKKQSELLSDLGVRVDRSNPAHPDTIAQTEMFDDVTDQMHDLYLKDNQRMKGMIGREDIRRKQVKRYKIIEKKYFKKEQEPNLLTYDAKEQIRYLNATYPEEWTPERIAQSFPVSVEGAKRFLRKVVKIRYLEDVVHHDYKVQQRWLELKSARTGEGGPLANRYKQLVSDGQLDLLKNAAGYSSYPAPQKIPLPSKHSRSLNRDPDKPPGPWASIVHDYCLMQDNLTGRNKDLISRGNVLHVPQKPQISDKTKTTDKTMHDPEDVQEERRREQAAVLQDVMNSLTNSGGEDRKYVKADEKKKETNKTDKMKAEVKKKGVLNEKAVKEKEKKNTNKSFEGWFSFDNETEAVDEQIKPPEKIEQPEKIKPWTMLQSSFDNDPPVTVRTSGDQRMSRDVRMSGDQRMSRDVRMSGDQRMSRDVRMSGDQRMSRDVRASSDQPMFSDQRKSTLRRKKVSPGPDVMVHKMLYSDSDLEDMSVMFRKTEQLTREQNLTVQSEFDPGFTGTGKVKARGVSYTELLKQEGGEGALAQAKTTSAASFKNRQGAYGYFDKGSFQENDKKFNFRDNAAGFDSDGFDDRREGGPGEVGVDSNSEGVRKKGNKYYDESGGFLFKTPEDGAAR